jgi:hypothetical protein
MPSIPRLLYRYRSLLPSAREFVERTITHGELYFAKPSSFNDPFDCQPTFSFDATDLEILKYFTRVGMKPENSMTPDMAMANARHKLHNRATGPRSPVARETMQKLHTDNVAERIGVLCMSEVRDDILMWGHYADNHRGICLGYETSNTFFENAHPVTYSPERPTINPFRDTSEQMLDAAVFTKAEHWRYEREWRQISFQAGAGLSVAPPEALAVVILGCKATAEAETLVKTWIRRSKAKPRLLRALPDPRKFSLKFHTVKS